MSVTRPSGPRRASGLRALATAIVVLATLAAFTDVRAQTWNVVSPGGTVSLSVRQDVIAALYADKLNLYYRTFVGESIVLDWSPLGIKTSDQDFITGLTFVGRSDSVIDETYTLPHGKRSTYVNRANQTTLTFKNANERLVSFIFRAYDDAVAFRYEIDGAGAATITGEQSGFNLPVSGNGWVQTYNPAYEATYDRGIIGTTLKTGDIGFPALFESPAPAWMLISEAAVFGDYCGSRLAALSGVPNVLMIKFPQASLTGTLPWKTPWRVVILGRTLAPLVESSVIEHLNPPSEVADVSWVKPGRAAWSWLSENTGDLAQQQAYTAFAREMGWEYNLIDDGFNKANMPALAQFSADSGVGMELWYRYSDLNTQAKQDAAFQQVKTWGVKSLKIDFIENDNQATMKWYEMTAKNLAQYQLMATYHGSTIPRGERRRWPHIMTYEGVRGAEFYGRGYPGPVHNATLPFTRQLVGPMDVTPVLFTTTRVTNGVPSERTTTDAHELAHAVLYESGIQHFADKPSTYRGHPAAPFLRDVPAAWDETRFLDGYPGERAVIARRKGDDWYVAGIRAGTAGSMTLSLDFLKPGGYTVELYRDSIGAARALTVETIALDPSTPLTIAYNANGGFAFKVAASYQVSVQGRETPQFRLPTKNGTPYDLLGRPVPTGHDARTIPRGVVRKPE